MDLAVLALPLLLAVGFYFFFRHRLRRTGYDEWYSRWKQVQRSRRKRIQHAVRRGEAVQDPRDAELALELIEHSERLRDVFPRGRFARFVDVALGAFLVVLAAGLALSGSRREAIVLLAPVLVLLALVGVISLVVRGREDRVEEARRANEALLSRFEVRHSLVDGEDGPQSLNS